MRIVAFDPGKNGGVAWKLDNGEINAVVMPMMGDEIDFNSLRRMFQELDPELIVLEKQWARPDNPSRVAFELGLMYGGLRGLCVGLQIPYELVAPTTWKNQILKGFTKKDKDAAIEYCTRIYPSVSLLRTPKCKKPHDGIADALCILTYSIRNFENAAA